MIKPENYVPHESLETQESLVAETEAIQHALTGVFAAPEFIEKECIRREETSKHGRSWNTGDYQFIAVEHRRVLAQNDLLAQGIWSLLQGGAASLEIDEDDSRIGEEQPAKVRMTRTSVGDNGWYELRCYDYNYANGRLQVLNQVMTEEQFETFHESPAAQERHAEALDEAFSLGMTASEEEWDDFKAALVSFPTD